MVVEYTRAITIRAVGLCPRALIVIALVYSKTHTTAMNAVLESLETNLDGKKEV